MKQYRFMKWVGLIALLLGVILSCQDDFDFSGQEKGSRNNASVSEAKNWYDATIV
jgi:hypothetical protein